MDSLSDDDILDRLSELVRTERGPLAALARAQGVSPEDAVDCVQEGLCTLLSMNRRGALPETIREWGPLLAGIVKNVARNRRRRHFLSRPHQSLDDDAPIPDRSRPSDEAISRAEDHVRLHSCVNELCAIQKAVVTLRMLEEQSGDDVARALGISVGHVAVLLHRAKNALRACMTD